MTRAGYSEDIIENAVGCGPFQFIAVFMLYVAPSFPKAWSLMMMSFGGYNPGWRCLDNATSFSLLTNGSDPAYSSFVQPSTTITTITTTMPDNNQTLELYPRGLSCAAFEACQRVEFDPTTPTIATEWSLLCDKAWIASLVISIEMAGVGIGASIAGQIADTFGRKKLLFTAVFFTVVFNFALVFSSSWQMFAALRFPLGVCCGCLSSVYLVYTSEFIPSRWRGPISGLPAWAFATVLYGLVMLWRHNWRHHLIATGIVGILAFLSVFWIPESLRWLEVNNKSQQFVKAAKKMAKVNRKPLPQIDGGFLLPKGNSDTSNGTKTKKYTMLDLFTPGYRLYTVVMASIFFTVSVVYFAISFGVKDLAGNFYLNFILTSTVIFPCCFYPMFVPNILGRKLAAMLALIILTASLAGVVILDVFAEGNTGDIGKLVMVMLCFACVDVIWSIFSLMIVEMYPTVVRGLALSFVNIVARIGAVIGPFLVPKDRDGLQITYTVMGALCLGCCCAALFCLPETKGKPMKETFEMGKERTLEIIEMDE